MVSFNEFMAESKVINRWSVLKIGLFGGFCGALLTVIFVIAGMA